MAPTMSRPCLAPGDSGLWLVLGKPTSCLVSHLSCRLPCFPASFLPLRPTQDSLRVVMSAPRHVSGLLCSGTHLSIFLAVQGVRRALLQHQASHEPVLSYRPSSLPSVHGHVWSSGTWEGWGVADLSRGLQGHISALGDLSELSHCCPSVSASDSLASP